MNSEVKSLQIDLEKVVGLKESSQWWDGQCPMCAQDGRDKKQNHLRVWKDGKFNCIVDKSSEHRKYILDLVGVEGSGVVTYVAEKPRVIVKKEWPVDMAKGLIKNYDYWEGRGISAEVCRKFEIGVAAAYAMANRTVIPIYNIHRTKIIGFTGRKLEKESDRVKWKHMGSTGTWVWPFQPEAIRKSKRIILTEGPGDVLTFEAMGIDYSICLFSVVASSAVMSYLIRENPDEIFIALNNELDSTNKGVGNEASLKLYNQLLAFFNPEKLIMALPIGAKDFNAMNKDQLDLWRAKYL